MRKSTLLLLCVLPFVGSATLAQYNMPVVQCDACRHPIAHPEDYANFAFNQVYGPDAWMTFEQADDFFILSPEGLRVYVDLDYIFLAIGVEGLRLPVWPTQEVSITIALPNGQLITLTRSVFLSPLPVPANLYDPTPDAGNGDNPGDNGSGEGGGDDGEWDPIEDEPEEPDWDDGDSYVGVTGIEDPDEEGNFPDPDWCEEC